ncbi:MAG: hypothetical protein JW822_05280 [Spirochaetales bacterium]|nr:hypothetical protein [Spirochaetales bacterium]
MKYFIAICFCVFMIVNCTPPGSGPPKIPSDPVISYDVDSLIKGRTVLFQTDEYENAEYKWSYKGANEDDFILVEGASAFRVPLVFVETGEYQLKLVIDDEAETVVDLDIIDAVYDPATYTALTFIKQLDDSYTLFLRFSDDVLNTLRNADNALSFFDMAIWSSSFQQIKYCAYGCEWDDNTQAYVIDTGISSLMGVIAPHLTDNIEIEIAPPEITRHIARQINTVDHLLCHQLNDDPLVVTYKGKSGYPVITDAITDFTLYY